MAATIDVSKFLTSEKLEAIFKTFDINNSGELTAEDFKIAFSKFGKELSNEEVIEIMK